MIHPSFRGFLSGGVTLALAVAWGARLGAEEQRAAPKANSAFGAAVQLAPFVVKGEPLSISIHARTPADRRYAEKFANEVVELAYETLGQSTGAGLVVIGQEGEPHPVLVMRKFLAMAAAGQLDPAVAAKAGELTAQLAAWQKMLRLDVDPDAKGFKLTFDLLMPALPLPLEGLGSQLYQLAWAEDFDLKRVERKLATLTASDLKSDALSKYNWVFYLPPRNAYIAVQDEVIRQAVKKEKLGLLKRSALKSALFVLKPAIKTAVEGMRQGMLYLTVLRAQSDYSEDDILALTGAYANVLMPDFKFNGGSEHRRAMEAIERQKILNAEYAKDPFVAPPRLTTFDPATYALYAGDYSEGKITRHFKGQDNVFHWQNQDRPALAVYPAGERLFVTADARLTIEFKVDEKGVVTGAEERRARYRRTFSRQR